MAILGDLIVRGVARVVNKLYASSIETDSLNGITSTEISYLDGVTSNIQTQLNAKLSLTGGTLSGALTFANGTWNSVGDDVAIGDHNSGGSLGIKGLNSQTKITLVPYSGSVSNVLSIDGSGTLNISGTTSGNFNGDYVGRGHFYGVYQSNAGNRYSNSALEIRENDKVGSTQSDIGYAPTIGFRWANRIGASLAMASNGEFRFINQSGSGYSDVRGNVFYGSLSGNAATATALGTSAGSTTQPIYFSSGKPVATTYELNAHVKSYLGALSTNGWKSAGGREKNSIVSVIYNNSPASWNSGTYSSTIVFGSQDTKGFLDCSHGSPIVSFGGSAYANSTDDNPNWYMKLSGTTATTYNLDNFPTKTGGNASGTWGISISGNASTSTTATNVSGGSVSATSGTFSGQMASNTIKLNNKWTVSTNATSGAIEWNY